MVDDINPALPSGPPKKNYGTYGMFLIMGNAGFLASIVGLGGLGLKRFGV